jgi:hypothetical protein
MNDLMVISRSDLLEVLEVAANALRNSYDATVCPGDGTSDQDKALKRLLSFTKDVSDQKPVQKSLNCDCPNGSYGKDHTNQCYETRLKVETIDAEKWRALRNCARITAMGSAGMRRLHDPDAHVTLNFWTHNERESQDDPARQWLDIFTEKAMRLSSKADTVPATHEMLTESYFKESNSDGGERSDVRRFARWLDERGHYIARG